MYKIDRSGGRGGGVQKSFSRNLPHRLLGLSLKGAGYVLGQALRLEQARGTGRYGHMTNYTHMISMYNINRRGGRSIGNYQSVLQDRRIRLKQLKFDSSESESNAK